MSDFTERRKVRKRIPLQSQRIPGQLGDGYANVRVPDLPNHVYCKIGDRVEIVYNDQVPFNNELLVWVGRNNSDSEKVGAYRVLSMRSSNPIGAGGTNPATGYAPSRRYRFLAVGGGQDPLWVEGRQIMPLRIGPQSGLTIQLQPGLVWNGTQLLAIPFQLIDLTSYLPDTDGNAVMVAITIAADGSTVITAGTEFTLIDMTSTAWLLANIPALPSDSIYFCGAVRLYFGQAEFSEGQTNTDIVDPRFAGILSPSTVPTPPGPDVPETTIRGRQVGAGTGPLQNLTPLEALTVLSDEFGAWDTTYSQLLLWGTSLPGITLTDYPNGLFLIPKVATDPSYLLQFGFGHAPQTAGYRAEGTIGSPTAITNSKEIYGLRAWGHDGSVWALGGSISFWTTEDWSSGNNGSELRIYTIPAAGSSPVKVATINENGIDLSANAIFTVDGDAIVNDWSYTPAEQVSPASVNLASFSAGVFAVMMVGKTITVAGVIDLQAAAPGPVSVAIDIPAYTQTSLAGVGTQGTGEVARVRGSSPDYVALIEYVAVSTAVETWSFTYTYRIP